MTGEENVALQKAATEAIGFLDGICKPAPDQLGLLLSEKVYFRHVMNMTECVHEWRNELKAKGINNPKPISPKTLYSYLEAVQHENEPELRVLWKNLMTNYVDPSKSLTLTVYPGILKELSTPEVKILKFIVDNACIQINSDKESIDIPEDTIENLERLNLIANYTEYKTRAQMGTSPVDVNRTEEYILTPFGHKFMNAVGVNSENWSIVRK